MFLHQQLTNLIHGRTGGCIPAVLRGLLLPFSLLYLAAVTGRNILYRLGLRPTFAPGVPVISIGNITVGGTGKTPIACFIIEHMLRRGRHPALLARGYGAPPGELNDELTMIKDLFPGIIVKSGPDRAALAREAAAEGADVIVLDDGFQHRRLRRECDILVVDFNTITGPRLMLPAGPFREPWYCRRRADIILLTKGAPDGVQDRDRIRARAGQKVFACRHVPRELIGSAEHTSLAELRGREVLLCSGIGDPGHFRRTAEALAVRVRGETRLRDHHAYTARDIQALLQKAEACGASLVLTTAKDMVKIKPLLKNGKNNIEFLALSITMDFLSDDAPFRECLDACIQA